MMNTNTNTPRRDSNTGTDSPRGDAGGTNNDQTPAAAAATGGTNDSVPAGNDHVHHASSDNLLELRDDHGPPVPIGTIEAQLDESELGGKSRAKPSGNLEQIEDNEGPSANSSAALAASLEATKKSRSRRHVETIKDNAAPNNPFDSTAFEFDDDVKEKEEKINMLDERKPSAASAGEECPNQEALEDTNNNDAEAGIHPQTRGEDVDTTPPSIPSHRGSANNDIEGGNNSEVVNTPIGVIEAIVTNRTSTSDEVHVAEAYAVEEEREQEVVVATHLQPAPALPWLAQRKTKLLLGSVLVVFAALLVAMGVALSSSSGNNAPTSAVVPPFVVEETESPSESQVPTPYPSVILPTTGSSTPPPSLRPTNSPTPLPSTPPKESSVFTPLSFSSKLIADDGAPNDEFGRKVAVFGDTLVVNAIYDDDKGDASGSVYIYHQGPEAKEWILQQKLVPGDGSDGDEFGSNIAIYDNTILVGAIYGDDKGTNSGAAYVYHKDPEAKEWIMRQKLVPDDGTPSSGDFFGASVAVFGDTLVVGAPGDDDKRNDSGSAYIYQQDPETKEWILQQKLVADDGAEGDYFGSSVAIYDSTIVVGARKNHSGSAGSAYVYHHNPEAKEWIFQQNLVPDDGVAYDNFGWSVAIYEDTVVVGAYGDDDKGNDSGSSYIYQSDPETKEWILQQKLIPDDGTAGDYFGFSVAVYGRTIVVSARWDDDKGDDSGSVYIYHQDSETKEWVLKQKLEAYDGAAYDLFGYSVAIYEDTVVVGAIYDDINDKEYDSGSVYVYS